MNSEDTIRDYVAVSLLKEKSPQALALDEDLMTPGKLDSMMIVQLVMFLEQTFQIEVDIGEITEENIGSVDRIVSFVDARTITT